MLYWSGGMTIFPAKIKIFRITVYGFNGERVGWGVGVLVHVWGGWRLSMGDIMQVPKVLGRVCR